MKILLSRGGKGSDTFEFMLAVAGLLVLRPSALVSRPTVPYPRVWNHPFCVAEAVALDESAVQAAVGRVEPTKDPAEGILLASIAALITIFELTGPVCISLVAIALAAVVDAGTREAVTMQLGLGEVTAAEKLAAVWVASEAAFYLVQACILPPSCPPPPGQLPGYRPPSPLSPSHSLPHTPHAGSSSRRPPSPRKPRIGTRPSPASRSGRPAGGASSGGGCSPRSPPPSTLP